MQIIKRLCCIKICDKICFSSGQYSGNKNIRFKTSMLTSDLRDYSDADIVYKGQ